MADPWSLGSVTWTLAVLSWFMSPVISLAVNKLFAYLSVAVDVPLQRTKLEIEIIPKLKRMLMDVQEQIMLKAAKGERYEDDLDTLHIVRKDLKSALYDAEDILDLIDYHRIEKKVMGDTSNWEHRLRDFVRDCFAGCNHRPSCSALMGYGIEPVGRCASARCSFRCAAIARAVRLRCAQGWHQLDRRLPPFRRCRDMARAARLRCVQGLNQLLCWWAAQRGSAEEQSGHHHLVAGGNPQEQASSHIPAGQIHSEEAQQPSHDLEAGEAEQKHTSSEEASLDNDRPSAGSSASAGHHFCDNGNRSDSMVQRLYSWLLSIYNSRGSILIWLFDAIAVLSTYRDWSYEVVGIKNNKKDDDSFLLAVHRKSLRERMEQINSIITVLEKSPVLEKQSSSNKLSTNDTDNEISSTNFSVKKSDNESSRQKEIGDMHRNITLPQVFGRDKDLENICSMLRAPSSNTSKIYSVICIHGISGSGKTTMAQYVCQKYEKEKDKYFDLIMFIQVSKTFRWHDILLDMLKQITGQDGLSHNPKNLPEKLKEKLHGRRFLLVLDDWENDGNVKDHDTIIDALDAGKSGSRILVTAQTKGAAAFLGAQEQIKISDLDKEGCFNLLMHHALQGTADADETFKTIGEEIVKKLHGSPIAAVTVAKRLQKNKNIRFWETTASLDVLNETMGALYWSYQQLSANARRCFEYFSIFPKGYKTYYHKKYCCRRNTIVNMWIAQGFIKSSDGKELEDLGQHCIEELLTFSFISDTGEIAIHDLLHELAVRVAGSDFFWIGGINGFDSDKGIPPEVRHLFVETDVTGEKTVDQILKLENLRTLIIEGPFKAKLFEGMFKMLTKLRVLMVITDIHYLTFVPESVGEMKHLRYLYLTIHNGWWHPNMFTLPSSFSKLYHAQILEGNAFGLSRDDFYGLHRGNMIFDGSPRFPNVGRLTSLKEMGWFSVGKEQGYGLNQLKHLNKLQGHLSISGLENVSSKDEALEANLAGKTRLKRLSLFFNSGNPDVQAEVLEGLSPPEDLECLHLVNYGGLRYPSWMLRSHQNSDGQKNLYRLQLHNCSQLVSIPDGSELFAGLRELHISYCTWKALPDHMEHLKSLKKLEIDNCDEIELLPTLPESLENIRINCMKRYLMLPEHLKNRRSLANQQRNKLWASFRQRHENWEKIKHVPEKEFVPKIFDGDDI